MAAAEFLGIVNHAVEDQGGEARLDDVQNRFGERVAGIVEACSDSLADTAKGERKAHWKKRKEAYLVHLQEAPEDILRVSLADKVHNARAILRDLRKADVGEKIWESLKISSYGTTAASPRCSAESIPASCLTSSEKSLKRLMQM